MFLATIVLALVTLVATPLYAQRPKACAPLESPYPESGSLLQLWDARLLVPPAESFSRVGVPPEGTSDSSDGRTWSRVLTFAAASGVVLTTLVQSYVMWWDGGFQRFGWYDPNERGGWFKEPGILGLDKVGHLVGSSLSYRVQKALFRWGGFDEREATWMAAGFTGALALLIELGDGFTDYSFDARDLVMNAAGLGFELARERWPAVSHFRLKWSYIPPRDVDFHFTRNYDGNVFWLSADIASLAPESVGRVWPRWLAPAVGFSVDAGGTRREFVVGFDLRLEALLPQGNRHVELLRTALECVRVPAPGASFAPGRAPKWEPLLLY